MSRLSAGGVLAALATVLGVSGCLPASDVARLTPGNRACTVSATGPGVSWYGPAGAGDAANLEEWCRTVGPAVFQSRPPAATFDGGPTGVGLGTSGDVLVASWNPNAGAGDLLRFIEDELGHSCASGRPESHFVLLLQEALRRSPDIPATGPSRAIPPPVSESPRGSERVDVVRGAQRCGLSLFYVAAARNGAGEREGLREEKGNAILSSLPISDPAVVELPFEGARRVSAVATVTAPTGDSFRVASVHFLSSARPWRVLTTGNASRLREASGLLEALDHIEAETGALPTIAAGDLNTWSMRETALLHLRDHFEDSPDPLDEPTRGSFPTDHILFRSGPSSLAEIPSESYRRIDDTYNSDHHPVIAALEMAPPRERVAR